MVSENKVELLGDTVTFPSEVITEGVEVHSFDTIYQYYKQKYYSIPFAIKTQNEVDETYDSTGDVDLNDIRLYIDGKAFTSKNVYTTRCYYGRNIYLGATIPDSSVTTGNHTVKVAVKRGDKWYSGQFETTFVKPNIKDQVFELNPDGAEPKAANYFSAKKGGIIDGFSDVLISDYVALNSQGHQIKSLSLVKHGTNTAVKINTKIKTTGVGALYVSPFYRKYQFTEDYNSMETYLTSVMPSKESCMSVLASISIDEEIDEGWYDIVVVADSGSKATYLNAYYATKKPVLFDIGYILPWYYGEPIIDASGDYVAAFVYGVNISDNIYPTYYDGEIPMTGEVVNKEYLLDNDGYNYLLKKTNIDKWNDYNGAPSLTIKSNLGDDIIDLRNPETKDKPVNTPYAITFPQWNTPYMWADSDLSKLGFNGETTFAIYRFDSVDPLVTGIVDTGKKVDDLVPKNEKYKFNHNDIYRVVGYNSYGVVVSKEYYNQFTTGQFSADSVEITISQTEGKIGVGQTLQLTATVGPEQVTDKTVKWSSSKTSVATVDANGLVTAVAPGNVTITATSNYGSKKVTCKLEVVERIEPVIGIAVNEKSYELKVGETVSPGFRLIPENATERDVTWESSNEKIVKVTKDGTICAVGAGTTYVSLTVHSPSANKTFADYVYITVTKVPVHVNYITLDHDEIVIDSLHSYRLNATINPSDADNQTINWSVEDDSIAKISYQEGAMIFLTKASDTASGETVVTATTEDGSKKASCKVTILKNDAAANSDSKTPADDGKERDLWISTIEPQTYTGSKLTPEIRVYDGTKELTKGTDYTVTYSNNINACAAGTLDSKGKNIGPKATVKFKGNYKGESLVRSFTIEQLNINSMDEGMIDFYEASVVFKAGKTYKPVPTVTYKGKKLKAGKDYTYEYYKNYECKEEDKLDQIAGQGVYYIRITGIGNFNSVRTIDCNVFDNTNYVLMDSTKVVCDPAKYEYDPDGVFPKVSVTWNGKPVSIERYYIEYPDESYKRVGKVTILVSGKGTPGEDGVAFIGCKRVTFTITGTPLSKAADVAGVTDKTYTGSYIEQNEAKLTLKSDGSELTEGTDYEKEYSKNLNAGTATVIFKGKGRYTGTIKKTFKITKPDANTAITIEPIGDVPYAKGGAKPNPTVKYGENVLTLGKDYTLSYKYNTAVTTDTTTNKPMVTVKFKGNYAGSKTAEFKIVPQYVANIKIEVPDKAYSTKKNAWMSAPVLTDLDGKKLKAGTDYEKLTDSDYSFIGKNWGENPAAGTIVTVTITGKGNYAGSTFTDSYRIFANNISKAKFKIGDKVYTGMKIALGDSDFTVKTLSVKSGKTNVTENLMLGRDFEIVSYSNNLKKGTATVVIRGIGGKFDLGGTRKLTFKIVAKDSKQLEEPTI